MKALWLICCLCSLAACAGDPGFEDQREDELSGGSGDSHPPEDSDATQGGSGESDATDDDSDSTDESSDALDDGEDLPDANDDSGDEEPFDSRSFFNAEVVPKYGESCTTCHADPRFNPPVQGPLTIFNFKRVENLLRSGEGPLSNDLYEKIAGVDTHGGGDQCIVNPDLCATLETWWQSLLGTGATSTALSGEVSTVTEDGRVTGWAVDRGDADTVIAIRVFVDGDASTGVLAFEAEANLSGFDNGTSGNHAFALQLPAEYRDGTQHTVHVYGMLGSDLVLLPGAPQTFTAYTPNPDGEAYYNNNILPVLQNRCGSCHAVDYSIQWASLLSPAPNKGGTATNNELINKPSGQIAHGGGNLCGGINGSPCSLFQEWWDLEFN